jgi:hypothetical protein
MRNMFQIWIGDIMYVFMLLDTCIIFIRSCFWRKDIYVCPNSLPWLWLIDWLIDWCLMPTLAIFQLYRGVNKFPPFLIQLVMCKILCGHTTFGLNRYISTWWHCVFSSKYFYMFFIYSIYQPIRLSALPNVLAIPQQILYTII